MRSYLLSLLDDQHAEHLAKERRQQRIQRWFLLEKRVQFQQHLVVLDDAFGHVGHLRGEYLAGDV